MGLRSGKCSVARPYFKNQTKSKQSECFAQDIHLGELASRQFWVVRTGINSFKTKARNMSMM